MEYWTSFFQYPSILVYFLIGFCFSVDYFNYSFVSGHTWIFCCFVVVVLLLLFSSSSLILYILSRHFGHDFMRIKSYDIILCYIYHIISYHIISYHIISYHIILHIISYHSVDMAIPILLDNKQQQYISQDCWKVSSLPAVWNRAFWWNFKNYLHMKFKDGEGFFVSFSFLFLFFLVSFFWRKLILLKLYNAYLLNDKFVTPCLYENHWWFWVRPHVIRIQTIICSRIT